MTNGLTTTITKHFQEEGLPMQTIGRRIEVVTPRETGLEPWRECVGVCKLLVKKDTPGDIVELSATEVTGTEEYLFRAGNEYVCVAFYPPSQSLDRWTDAKRFAYETKTVDQEAEDLYSLRGN